MGGSSKRQVVAYKYYEDQHIVLGLSNYDFISHIWFADKLAWIGLARGLVNGYSQIVINQKNLFGGEKREGGVSGVIDVGMGWPEQPINEYLVSRLGNALMPAYRGVVSLIFRDFYFGNNPYLKALKVRAQAIHKLSDGSPQWYDEKAEIAAIQEYQPVFTESFSGGLGSYVFEGPIAGDVYSLVADRYGNALRIDNGPSDQLNRITYSGLLPSAAGIVKLKFKIAEPSTGDCGRFDLMDADGNPLLYFIPYRSDDFDVLRRPSFLNSANGQPAGDNFIGDGPVTVGEWYEATLRLDSGGGALCTIVHIDSGTLFGEIAIGGTLDLIQKYRFRLLASPAVEGSIVHYDDLRFYQRPPADINPVHFIRECHTDRIWGGRYPESKMGESYVTAADTVFNEGLGVSFLFTDEVPWKEIIEEVARHIDAIPYQDPDTGLMEIKLIRDDYDVETIPVLDPSNSDLERIQEPNDWEIFNQVIIKFWNRQTGKNDSVTLSDPAGVDMVGGPKPKTFEYSGVCTKKVAMMVGERDLARVSKPFHQGRVKINRSVANLKPGDVFLLNSPEDNIQSMVCRVTSRKESGLLNGDITIEFGEDIFGEVYTTFAEPEESVWVDPVGNPRNFLSQTAFEVPYYLIVQEAGEAETAGLAEDACSYGFAGVSPETGAHIDYDLYIYPDGTSQEPDIEFAITAAFTPHAIVSETVEDPNILEIPVEPLFGMDSVRVGQVILVGDDPDSEREAIAVEAAVSNGDETITVRRGVIDTTPKPITAGTTLYFVETFYGGSETQYITGETVEGYGVPTNGLGAYQGPYVYIDRVMAGRFNKPYPPGNLRIDNLPLPQNYRPTSNTIDITWSDRDRVLQSDQVIDFFDTNNYGPEAGTTYRVVLEPLTGEGTVVLPYWIDTNVGSAKTYQFDLSANTPPTGAVKIRVRVWSVRDSVESLQPAEAFFDLLAAPLSLSALYKPLSAPSSLSVSEV